MRIFSTTKKKLHCFVIVSATMDKHNLLHPPIQVKKFKDKDEIMIIHCLKDGKFDIVFWDAHFRQLPKSMDVPVEEFSNFLDSDVCRNIKAVLFGPDDYDVKPVIIGIRQMVYKEATKRELHLMIIHPKTTSNTSMLFAANIDSKPGDVILRIVSLFGAACVSEFRRKPQGYSYIGKRNINGTSSNDLANKILASCEPKYIIVFTPENDDLANSLKSRGFPSKNVIYIYSGGIRECTSTAVKTIFNEGYNQIIPFSLDVLAITNDTNFTNLKQAVITVDDYEDLPLEKTKVVPRSNKPYFVAYLDKTSESYKPAGKAQESKEKEGHRIKLALVVDRNSLPFLYQEPFIVPEIEALPQKLTSSKANLNVPVIGFYDYSSVICVRDDNGYRFLKSWNGLIGHDLFISFEPKEPFVVTDLNKVNDKDPFMIYDLVKVLSMPANDVKVDPKWGFKVTRDVKNSVLLEVQTFFGSHKYFSPIFLMARLLNNHILAIENETGKKPTQVAFCLFTDFNNAEKNRVQNGLQEACKILKIDFVTVDNF